MSKNEATPKIALVTGASRGLGYSVAKALAAQGSQIVAVARTVVAEDATRASSLS
ncbi:MAG: SDR family NAD(P)-dependent oxidoreductase [Pseudomonadota bacterium]